MGSATTESSTSIDNNGAKETTTEQVSTNTTATASTSSSSPGRNRSGSSPTRTPAKTDPLTAETHGDQDDQDERYPMEHGAFSPSSTDTLRSLPLPSFSPLASVLKAHPEGAEPLNVRETVQRYEAIATVGRRNDKIRGNVHPSEEHTREQRDGTSNASQQKDGAWNASQPDMQQPIKEPLQPTRSMMDSISYWTSAVIGAVNTLGTYDDENVEPTDQIQDRPPSAQPQDTSLDDLTPITLSGRNDDEIELKVMTREIAEQVFPRGLRFPFDMSYSKLRVHFPRRYRSNSKWTLVYSLEQHGISISSLYSKLHQHCEGMYGVPGSQVLCPSILILRDADGGIFGAFVTEVWRPNSGSGTAKEHQGMFTGEGRTTSSSSLFAGSVARGRSFYGSGEW